MRPTPLHAGVQSVFPSICTQGRPHVFYWYPTDDAGTLEEAFEAYVCPQFYSPYAAAEAEEEFLDTIRRAKRGVLKPVFEVKEIRRETTEPERLYEIRNSWPNTQVEEKRTAYLGSRLFHAEPTELGPELLGLYLMAKKEKQSDVQLWDAQTGNAIVAKQRLQECRRGGWQGIVAC